VQEFKLHGLLTVLFNVLNIISCELKQLRKTDQNAIFQYFNPDIIKMIKMLAHNHKEKISHSIFNGSKFGKKHVICISFF